MTAYPEQMTLRGGPWDGELRPLAHEHLEWPHGQAGVIFAHQYVLGLYMGRSGEVRLCRDRPEGRPLW